MVNTKHSIAQYIQSIPIFCGYIKCFITEKICFFTVVGFVALLVHYLFLVVFFFFENDTCKQYCLEAEALSSLLPLRTPCCTVL